ncbi:putative N6-adenine-specific DNA methylase [Shimia gijangensis]|uniref:Putative N6-adenine-specific DNA methylase n=1 Tax=Shimia gijangensis TaxID=1470563 RepID=A0A1M6JU31_9RHOB|nr:class I SAM-dependent RNA methyltransferase [Shimia gijangensis]SHJ50169.1 putative N6-adenine-specific DNA methylase [Shimia gijangensis]
MRRKNTFEIFLVAAPGMEKFLGQEVREKGFEKSSNLVGGVSFRGDWSDVWRANLELRGATRVLARIGAFSVSHLAQLDKRAREFQWAKVLRPDIAVKVDVTCRKSKIYHAGAAAQRIETAITEELGAPISKDAEVGIKARIEENRCVLSIDTSGESLHKRGHKTFTGKAPMRETLAALFLRESDFDGTEPVIDPMCGSGTFIIEAAEIAAGFQPGRDRSFAFEQLATFDAEAFSGMRRPVVREPVDQVFRGFDRDAGAIQGAVANATRAGVSDLTEFTNQALSDLHPPKGPKGLVIVNPPYGARIGDKKALFGLYGALGKTLKERFSGWRVGIITTDAGLARATGLPLLPPGPVVAHGGLKVKLFRTNPLP